MLFRSVLDVFTIGGAAEDAIDAAGGGNRFAIGADQAKRQAVVLAKANEKFAREFLPADEDKRFRAQAKRLVGRFKEWTGTLSDEQEDRIERFVKAHMHTAQMRFENRRRWQREAVALLRQVRTPEELAARLADIFVQPANHRPPEYVRALVAWESDLTDLILDIERTLAPEQRAHVLRRMGRYAEDFEALSAQPAVAGQVAGN